MPLNPSETKKIYDRYDAIEFSILNNSKSNGRFLSDDYNYQPGPDLKIPMNE